MSVVANDDRLAIQPDNCVYDRLDRSREIARNALEFLPKTPITAVGVNVKFVTDSPPSQLLDICVNPLDTALSDGDFQISQRSWGWSLPLEDGRINLTLVATSDNSYEMHFNFHYATNDVDRQLKWLTQPIGNLRDNVRKITETCMNFEPTEVPDGQ